MASKETPAAKKQRHNELDAEESNASNEISLKGAFVKDCEHLTRTPTANISLP